MNAEQRLNAYLAQAGRKAIQQLTPRQRKTLVKKGRRQAARRGARRTSNQSGLLHYSWLNE